VIGMHWSNPPHLIPMIEVIPGERTSDATIAAAQGLIERVGYRASQLNKEVPGFVENRVLYAIMRECLALVDEGVIDAEELDLNVKWGIGYKLAVIPPMQLLDVAGLDIYESVANYLNSDLSTESGVSETITKLTEQGKLGIKAGGGLFEYSKDELAELPAKRAAALVAVRKTLDAQDV
jgi:3-hydroxyacyl-CoA dehydrogenase